MDRIHAHPVAALIGFAGIVAIIIAVGWYLARNAGQLAELREQAAAIMSPVMAGPSATYAAAGRRAGGAMAATIAATPPAAGWATADTERWRHEPKHAGADGRWADTLHEIVESTDRGSLLPAGMADPDIEAAYAALTDADIAAAAADAEWAAAWRRADRVIARATADLDVRLAAILGPKLVAESRRIARRRVELAAYITDEFTRPASPLPARPRQTPAQARRQRKRDNAAKGRPEAVTRELVAA